MKKTDYRTNRKSNTSLKGIHLHKNTNKYEARFNFKGSYHYIGSFDTIKEAFKARTAFIMKMI